MDGLLTPRTRKPRGQGHSRRGEILAAARRLFVSEGFGHATMRRIAAGVGVSPTALYVYFPDKTAILRTIAEETFEQLLAALERSHDLALSPLDRLRAGLLAYIRFGLSRPDEYRLVFVAQLPPELGPDPCSPGGITAADLSFDVLERGIAELQDIGVFSAGDAKLRAEAAWSNLHGVTSVLLDRASAIESEPDALIGTVIDMTIDAFRASPRK